MRLLPSGHTRRLAIAAFITVVLALLAGVALVLPQVLAAGPLAWIAVGIGAVFICVRGLPGGLRIPPPPRGARWATVRELKQAGCLSAHGWPLGAIGGRHTLRLPERLEREGILVCAAPGSGKSSGLAIPAILSEADRPLDTRRVVVVVDPKNELTDATLPTLATTHHCTIWDPSDPDGCTVGFDPLATLPKPTEEAFVGEVKHVARAWFEATRGASHNSNEQPFFVNQPRSLMEALFLAFVITHPDGTFVELAAWNSTLSVEAFQELLDQSSHPAVHASAEALRAVGLNERTIGPIWGDLLQRWDILIDPRVRRTLSERPPIDWEAMMAQPSALYLRIGAQDAERLAPLVTMAMGQLYREVTRIAARHPKHVLPCELRLIVDEFGNLPRIYGIETALATLRSYGVGHFLFAQNSAQITHRYAHDLAQSIQNSIVTKVILGGAAFDDAKAFSLRCGDITEHVATQSVTASGIAQRSRTHGYAPDRHPLITATEIVHMSDTVLVSTRGVMPICAELTMYFQDEDLLRRLEKDRCAYAEVQAFQGAQRLVEAPESEGYQREPIVLSSPELPASSATPPPVPEQEEPPVVARDHHMEDVPPPGCSAEEWAAAAASLHAARSSIEVDLLAVVSGAVPDLDALHARWHMTTPSCSPVRFAAITCEEAAGAPHVWKYLCELARRLEIPGADDPHSLVQDEPLSSDPFSAP